MTVGSILLLAALVAALGFAWVARARHRADAIRHNRELVELQENHRAQLQAHELQTAALFDRMVEGVIIVGGNGRIRLVNRAVADLFELSTSAIGRTVLEATRHHEVAEAVSRLGREREVREQEIRLERGGAPRFVRINAVALAGSDGSPDGAIVVFHDVTRLRQLESVRQDFVANVSHELRTPLSLIKSAAETLLDSGQKDPAVTTRFLEIIDKHAVRLTYLIDDLLLLSRLDSGRLELKFQPAKLRQVADDAIDDVSAAARARDVTVCNEIPASVITQADPPRLRQVFMNLLDNAVKYGKAGGQVIVRARTIDAQMIEAAVQDDGPGIPADAVLRVFERFYRVDKARAREQGGTGLGLAIVKNVVEAHGGAARVESSATRGTTFYFTLRRADDSSGA